MTTRREFSRALAAFAAATPLVQPVKGWLARWHAAPLPTLGVQLYTVRESMQRDLEGTLARVRGIGYREVEFAGYFGHTAAQLRAALGANGLAAPAAHVGLDALTVGLGDTLEAAEAIGHRWVVLAWIDPKDRTVEGYDRIADQLNAAGEAGRAAGIRIAYHTHDYVFRPAHNGSIPLERLLARIDPRLVDIELDLYWAICGGSDPRSWFERYPGRFPMVHVKDAGPAPDFAMADVGAGSIDWRDIFRLRDKAGIRHYFIEHDTPVEPWSSITASFRYLRHLSV